MFLNCERFLTPDFLISSHMLWYFNCKAELHRTRRPLHSWYTLPNHPPEVQNVFLNMQNSKDSLSYITFQNCLYKCRISNPSDYRGQGLLLLYSQKCYYYMLRLFGWANNSSAYHGHQGYNFAVLHNAFSTYSLLATKQLVFREKRTVLRIVISCFSSWNSNKEIFSVNLP